MVFPLDRYYPKDFDGFREVTLDVYRDTALAINGDIKLYTPIIEGGTTAGVGTYTGQEGYYLLRGSLAHVWFGITWSAHTGTGNLRVVLPFNPMSAGAVFVGTVSTSSMAFPAGTTSPTLSIPSGVNAAEIVCSGSGVARAWIGILAAGSIFGHISYLIESDT